MTDPKVLSDVTRYVHGISAADVAATSTSPTHPMHW